MNLAILIFLEKVVCGWEDWMSGIRKQWWYVCVIVFVKSGTISVAWANHYLKAKVFGLLESLRMAHGGGESF